jgi:L-lysine exporter family protein LysE/ArgO
MISALLTGFFLGFSLILAIGAQNAFVLRQGILREHIFQVALFCALSDTLLILFGIIGISIFFNNFFTEFSDFILGISALWLTSYGFIRLSSIFKSDLKIKIEISKSKNLLTTLIILSVLTFANPHVYLDTIILIGSISQQFSGDEKVAFAIGAVLASFVFFFSLGYGAKFLAPIMQSSLSWRILDFLIALVMFSIALNLAYEGNWI